MRHRQEMNNYTDFYYYAFRNILIISIPLVIISAIVLSSLHISATGSGSGTDSLTISISSACTLGSVVNTEHNTNTNVGTYTPNIGKTTITTLCNDGNGYSVYANGFSNNEEGNNKLINTEYPQYSIDTGLATSGLTSTWAMKLNNIPDDPSPTPPTIESDYNDTYGLVPSYWTKVASRASGTTDMGEGSSFTTTYAVYASSNQYAGTYVGQVKYVLTHPSYQPYVYYMQEVDKWKDTLALEQSVQAIDKRDGKSYWVTKLKDGNVWMTQNLDLEGGTSITSELSDVPEGYTLPIANGFGVNNTLPASSTSTFSNNTLAYVYNSGNNTNNCSKPGCYSYYSWVAATAGSGINMSENNSNAPYSICPKGWKLPTSGTRTPYTDYSDFYNLAIAYGMAPGSTSDSSSAAGGNFYVQAGPGSIPNFVLNGSYFNTLYNGNSLGEYWSATLINGQSSYRFSFSSSNVYTAYNQYGDHKYGNSIRCIAK